MARLQILELPTERHGDDMVTPFLLVIDQVDDDTAAEIARWPDNISSRTGARHVLCFGETVEIPANETAAQADPPPRIVDFAELEEAKRLTEQRDDARSWARHGYEIGQRHCSWTDYGVAPDWLTEGWPPHFGSCEHLQRAAEYDEAISRVLRLAEELEATEAHGGAYDASQEAARRIRAALQLPGSEKASTP